jgi:phage baseplate assembly protein W
MAITKQYSICFPFTAESVYKTFLDLNTNKYDSLKSDLTHLIFTPKGSRLLKPDFGTDLTKMLFEPSDGITYSDIQSEIQSVVNRWIPAVNIKEIIVTPVEEGRGVNVRIDYTVDEGRFLINDNIEVII